MSVFNGHTLKKDGSRADFFGNPPFLLEPKVNSKILDVIFKNIPELGNPNYKEFDITLSKLKENGDIKLIEDDNFKLAQCLAKLVKDEQVERAQNLIDRIHVAQLSAEQNYQFFAHCFAAISPAHPNAAISVTKALVASEIKVSTSVQIAENSQNAIQLAAVNFINSDPKNHEMEKTILLTLLESKSSSLDSEQKHSIIAKTNEGKLTKDDVEKHLRTEVTQKNNNQPEIVAADSNVAESKFRLTFGKSLLSFNRNKNSSEVESPTSSPRFSKIEQLKQKIAEVAQSL